VNVAGLPGRGSSKAKLRHLADWQNVLSSYDQSYPELIVKHNTMKWLLALLGGGACVTVNIMSNNVASNNTNTIPQSSKSPKTALTANSTYCLQDDAGDYVVVSKVGSREKSLVTIASGQEFWGDILTKRERCMQIASNYNIGKQKGATGWGTAIKNGYPIICAAIANNCILDDKGATLQLATFKRSVNPNPLVNKLRKQTDPDYEGSDAGTIYTNPTFQYFPE
jgi:hypothetical protein